MLKFFRRIRKSFIQQNKFGKYLIYAIGEVILVVIGILIALQLNTNAEHKKTNTKRQEYSKQLIKDFQEELEIFADFKAAVKKDEAAYTEYLRFYEKSELKPIEIYNTLTKLRMYSNTFTFNSSTIESLRSSGELILFPLAIRNKLMDLLRIEAEIRRQTDANNHGKNQLLMHLGRLRGSSNFIENLEGHPNIKDYLNVNRILPDIILGLDAAHKWKNLSETRTLNDLQILKEEMTAIIEMINTEMKK